MSRYGYSWFGHKAFGLRRKQRKLPHLNRSTKLNTTQSISEALGFQPEEESNIVPILLKWWGIVRRYWYWFVVSAILGLVAGYIYQQKQDRFYSGQTVVLIDDSMDAGSTGRRSSKGSLNTMMQLNGISVGDNLENELFILSSLRLMKNVVRTLNLEVDYTTSEGLHNVALYRNRPFMVKFERPSKRYASMEAKINPDNTITLTNFSLSTPNGMVEDETIVQAKLDQKINTPIGVLTIKKDNAFQSFPRKEIVKVTHYSNDVAARMYKSRITASEYSKNSSLIVLSCTDINQDRAEDILFEICEVYKNDIVDNKNRVAQRTAQFIEDRIKLIGSELTQVEQRFATFKQNNQIVDVALSASTMTQQTAQAEQTVTKLTTELSVANYLADFLRTTSGSKDVIPVVGNVGDPALGTQIAEYNRLALTRSRFAGNSSEEAPAVRDMDRQMDALRSAINSSLTNHVKAIEVELRAARANQAHFSGKAGQVPAKEREALDIARQQTLKEALYTFLLNKREEVALQLAIEEANVRVVEAPIFNNVPISPRKGVIMAIALLIGLLVPALIFWVLDLFDNTISSRHEVESILDIPIAGELPHVNKTNDDTLLFAKDADQNSAAVEAFRMLRYGLHFMNREAKVYMVTSSTPGQGKSFVSRNLASALSMTGKKVILVDTDVRKQNLSASFSTSHVVGLTQYLVGDEDNVHNIIQHRAIVDRVDFIAAGAIPPNITELLMSERLDTLVKVLREEYDYVILDTTPCFAVVDASIVSRVADVTLFVMRIGIQLKNGLILVKELHQTRKIGNLCLVINDADLKARTYGYGYGYGYGNAEELDAKRKWWQLW